MTRRHLPFYTVTIQFNQLDEGFLYFFKIFFIYYSLLLLNLNIGFIGIFFANA